MILQYPLAFTFLVLAFWLMYYILPNVPQHKRQILVGAVIAAVLWVVATTLFRLYVVNFTTFNKAYGTVGGVLAAAVVDVLLDGRRAGGRRAQRGARQRDR